MKTKHLNKFVIIGLFSFLILTSVAFAQNYNQSFQPLFDLLEYIFKDLGQNIIFRKFLIWMFLFAILSILVQSLPFLKEDNATQSKQAKIIAFVLSLIMAIGIPNAMINLIYDEYSLVAALALYLLVPILVFIATKDMENQVVRGIVFMIMGILLGIFTANASSGSWGTQLGGFLGWLYTASTLCLVAGIIMIVSGIGGGSGGGGGGGLGGLFRGRGTGGHGITSRLGAVPGIGPGSPTPTPGAPTALAAFYPMLQGLRTQIEQLQNEWQNNAIPNINQDLVNNKAHHDDSTNVRDLTAQTNYNTAMTNITGTLMPRIGTSFTSIGSYVTAAGGTIPPNYITSLNQLRNHYNSIRTEMTRESGNYARRLARYQT